MNNKVSIKFLKAGEYNLSPDGLKKIKVSDGEVVDGLFEVAVLYLTKSGIAEVVEPEEAEEDEDEDKEYTICEDCKQQSVNEEGDCENDACEEMKNQLEEEAEEKRLSEEEDEQKNKDEEKRLEQEKLDKEKLDKENENNPAIVDKKKAVKAGPKPKKISKKKIS